MERPWGPGLARPWLSNGMFESIAGHFWRQRQQVLLLSCSLLQAPGGQAAAPSVRLSGTVSSKWQLLSVTIPTCPSHSRMTWRDSSEVGSGQPPLRECHPLLLEGPEAAWQACAGIDVSRNPRQEMCWGLLRVTQQCSGL